MRQPNVQFSTIASLLLHTVVFGAFLYSVQHQPRYVLPKTYTVKLVAQVKAPVVQPSLGEPNAQQKPVEKDIPPIEPAKPAKYEMKEHPRPAPEPKQETKAAEIRPEPPKPMEAHKAPPVKPKEDGPKILKEAAKSAATKPEQTKIPAATPSKEQPKVAENASGKDTTSVEDRISMLRSKKRLEQHAALRSMVDLNAKSAKMGQSPTGASQSTSPSFGDAVNNEYSDIVGAHVRKRWAYPESAKKSLEAIVVFTIRQDGRVDGVKLEKSSGNSFFDRSALSAVNKSVPMPQPPLDSYEVGIRFTQ